MQCGVVMVGVEVTKLIYRGLGHGAVMPLRHNHHGVKKTLTVYKE